MVIRFLLLDVIVLLKCDLLQVVGGFEVYYIQPHTHR